MPIDSGAIAAQVGAAGGLWTHTPVDYRGNEGIAKPGGWPTDAAVAIPPNGSVPGAQNLAPTISAISVTGITATAATVNWTVAPSSVSVVDYGTTSAYGTSSTSDTGTGARTKALAGLTTLTLYHYRIGSTANGLTTYSSDRTFTTS